ncbi:hypothetical protein BDP55DRAFT_238522 [Colletotrichum godetiae]|uniref:Uncharacterized protein n=1 Tax=Colletotrichum godetiae TaxID=1209918 RepID=A0AAJ0EV02_9PEZI|nr:uncharacterized protein BDP55DRAFT_238522 [Colletotrichum godetiae]KAK1672775.1 hypothetical protein BDP55DRAFT_238522 [Colletotrichum godetiae]
MGKLQLYPLSTMVWICCCRCQNKPSKVLGDLCFSGEATTRRPNHLGATFGGLCSALCYFSDSRVHRSLEVVPCLWPESLPSLRNSP